MYIQGIRSMLTYVWSSHDIYLYVLEWQMCTWWQRFLWEIPISMLLSVSSKTQKHNNLVHQTSNLLILKSNLQWIQVKVYILTPPPGCTVISVVQCVVRHFEPCMSPRHLMDFLLSSHMCVTCVPVKSAWFLQMYLFIKRGQLCKKNQDQIKYLLLGSVLQPNVRFLPRQHFLWCFILLC